jgi:hypothetical protein
MKPKTARKQISTNAESMLSAVDLRFDLFRFHGMGRCILQCPRIAGPYNLRFGELNALRNTVAESIVRLFGEEPPMELQDAISRRWP